MKKADYAFIHIPKNAGTSIRNMLATCAEIEYFPHGARRSEIENYKKIYVIREPIDRFTSAFFYILKFNIIRKRESQFSNPNELIEAFLNMDSSANDFVSVPKGKHNINGTPINTDWAFQPQSKWIYDPYKILLYENLENELENLFSELKIKKPPEIIHNNTSKRVDFTYSDDSIRYLKLIYKDDFDLYDQLCSTR